MKTTTMLTMLVLAALLGFLAAGCVGTGDDICTMAALHLEACTGTTVDLPDACDEQKASRILNADCSKLAAAGTRSPYFFSDWFSNNNPPEPGGWNPPEPNSGPNKQCHCDQLCVSLGDCCPGCNGGNGNGNGNGQCFCDQLCVSKGDCCPGCGGGPGHEYLGEPSGGGIGNFGDQQGGGCAYQGGKNWRRCRQCGWQFCLPQGQWAQCQRPQEQNKFPCGGGQWCAADGFCKF